jgi:hypothetical protein
VTIPKFRINTTLDLLYGPKQEKSLQAIRSRISQIAPYDSINARNLQPLNVSTLFRLDKSKPWEKHNARRQKGSDLEMYALKAQLKRTLRFQIGIDACVRLCQFLQNRGAGASFSQVPR